MSTYTDAAKKKMDKSIDGLNHNFTKVRTGRANPHVLDDLKVSYYGTMTPINQLAAIKSEASLLIVEPWDKSCLKEIEKAIEASDLGITPNNDGVCIKLPFPQPTEERRKELVKECNKYAEEAKVGVRNARRDAIQMAEKDQKATEISEDDVAREKKAIQKVTDSYTKKIDEMLKVKTAEVMEI